MELRHFIDLWQLDAKDLRAILDDAKATKRAREGLSLIHISEPTRPY